MVHACAAVDIVEKEFDQRDSLSTSGDDLSTIQLKTDDDGRPSEGSPQHAVDFELVVGNSLHRRPPNDNRFTNQRENFANLYISGPPNDNDDVMHGAVRPAANHRPNTGSAADKYHHFSGDESTP